MAHRNRETAASSHPPQSTGPNLDENLPASDSPTTSSLRETLVVRVPPQKLPTPDFPKGLEVLHECSDASVDICFVHGLTGGRITAWSSGNQAEQWPKTILSPQLRKPRVLTWGYEACGPRSASYPAKRLNDHAANLLRDLTANRVISNALARPLILVAHGVGGLVCKAAILLSRDDPEGLLQNIFNSVHGVAFMGTPHRGRWMSDWARIPPAALGLATPEYTSLFSVLETDEEQLNAIQSRFSAMIEEPACVGRIVVACFYEELPVPGVGFIVPEASATMLGHKSFAIHADHSNLVKFHSAREPGFQQLLGEVARWEHELR
jgi:protein SERAC1